MVVTRSRSRAMSSTSTPARQSTLQTPQSTASTKTLVPDSTPTKRALRSTSRSAKAAPKTTPKARPSSPAALSGKAYVYIDNGSDTAMEETDSMSSSAESEFTPDSTVAGSSSKSKRPWSKRHECSYSSILLEDSGDEDDFVEREEDAEVRRGRRPARRPATKRAKAPDAASLMPVFGDMKLLTRPRPESESRVARGDGKGKAPQRMKRTQGKKTQGKGKKTKKETLEGDLSDLDGADDPRGLPETDIDYSKYSRLFVSHPHLKHAWSRLPEATKPQMVAQPAELKMRLLPFQREGVWWMAQQEHGEFHGGILADEMGMGKTLQAIALLLTNRGKPTLVVCPTVALLQWKAEIEAATDALSVFLFYGTGRKKLADLHGGVDKRELAKYDVVLTTYAVLESSFRRERYGFRRHGSLHHEKSLLHSVEWFRLVLDEAHNIKNRSSNSARAAFELEAQRTWSLTGTPLHNRMGELYSLVRLTRSDPFSMYFCHMCSCKAHHWTIMQGRSTCYQCGHKYTMHFCYWNQHILKPIQSNAVDSQQSRMGFMKLGKLLDNMMLRRTKVERAEDIGLPPRIIVTRRDKFSPEEEDFYVSLFTDYQREFDTYARHGTVLNNYANIFELITRMRLAANHPDLLRLKVSAHDKTGACAEDTLVCAICNEEAEDAVIAKCKHVFCREDARQYVEAASGAAALRCPSCYAVFDIDLAQPQFAVRAGSADAGSADAGSVGTLMETMLSTPKTVEYRRSIVNRIDMKTWRSSTKIEALVEELSRHRRGNANIKSIVFSQFVNFLDLIQWRLNRAGFSVCRLDGRMSPTQRDAVIKTFMTHPEYTVFLISLKAGGVALNLTEASNVYLADCWWNPSAEVQAMDRIHRMGQYRPIKITRIIIENSIESRIIALQVKKQLLINSTIGRDKKSLENLSAQDMQFLFLL